MKVNLFLLVIAITTLTACSVSEGFKEGDFVNYSFLVTGTHDDHYTNAGTGFIIEYKGKHYLVTNYHVLAHKDPDNEFSAPNDSNTAITVVFRPVDGKKIFYPVKYPLYNPYGRRNFSVSFLLNRSKVDVAVMPINVPFDVIRCFIKSDNVDSSLTYSGNKKLIIVGFPKGHFKNVWQPMISKSNSITHKNSNQNILDPYLYTTDSSFPGMSGSPVYIEEHGGYKLKGINTGNTGSEINDPKIKSACVLLKYAFDLIMILDKSNNGAVSGQRLPSR